MNDRDYRLREEIERRFGLATSWTKSTTQPTVDHRTAVIWENSSTGIVKILIRAGNTIYQLAPLPTSPSAYTQTYTTVDRTHDAPTATVLTDSTGGTAGSLLGAITGGAASCQDSTKNAVASLAAQVNALIADLADLKQLVNAVIDDLQSQEIVS